MKEVKTIQDVFPAVDELIAFLRDHGDEELARSLYHRLHHVSWTSGSELYEELRDIMRATGGSNGNDGNAMGAEQMTRIVAVIERELAL